MPRKQGRAVPKGNGPVPQHDEFGPDQPTLEDIHRLFEERLDRQLNQKKIHFDDLTEKIIEAKKCLADLEHEAQQPRLAMEADVTPDTKTRKHPEGAAANRAKHEDKSSSPQVDPNPMCLTNFGDDSTEPTALPCKDALWSMKALKRQNRVFHPGRCTH